MPVTLSGYACLICKKAVTPNAPSIVASGIGYAHENCMPVFPGAKLNEGQYKKAVAEKFAKGRQLVLIPEFPPCEVCGGGQYKINGKLECEACVARQVAQDRLLGRGSFTPKGENSGKKKRGSGEPGPPRVRARRMGRGTAEVNDRSLL